jgi:hypothetical protein
LHHKSELDGDGGVVRAVEALGDAKRLLRDRERLAIFASLETLINLLIELDELFANFNLNRCRRSWRWLNRLVLRSVCRSPQYNGTTARRIDCAF